MAESTTTKTDEHFERGKAAALAGEPWPETPGYNTGWQDWRFWQGYRSVEVESNDAR